VITEAVRVFETYAKERQREGILKWIMYILSG